MDFWPAEIRHVDRVTVHDTGSLYAGVKAKWYLRGLGCDGALSFVLFLSYSTAVFLNPESAGLKESGKGVDESAKPTWLLLFDSAFQ